MRCMIHEGFIRMIVRTKEIEKKKILGRCTMHEGFIRMIVRTKDKKR